jgi:ABC-type sugar transport system substrate-binding protein
MNDVFVVGVDGNRAGYKQVRDGVQAASIGQSFTQMAIKSLENARAILNGETVEKINFIPHDIVTLENVDILPEPEW